MAATAALPQQQTLFGFSLLSERWSVSTDLLRRMADQGKLKTIYLAGRRLVPVAEVLRVEQEGLGVPHKRGWKRGGK
jgi:hypothetical protein